MEAAVVIVGLLFGALMVCAALSLGFLALVWGLPAVAGFATFLYLDRLGVDAPVAIGAGVAAFIVVWLLISAVLRALARAVGALNRTPQRT